MSYMSTAHWGTYGDQGVVDFILFLWSLIIVGVVFASILISNFIRPQEELVCEKEGSLNTLARVELHRKDLTCLVKPNTLAQTKW